MKKIFTTALALFAIKGALIAQTCTAVPVVTLSPATVTNIATHMMVAYNPINKLYYWNSGGYGTNPVASYTTTGGAVIAFANGSQDYRGLWWNSNTNKLEGNCYSSAGIFTVALAANGNPIGGSTIVSTNQQPDPQSGGQYDPIANQVLYYNAGTIAKYSRVTGLLVSTVAITGLPVAFGNIATYGFYTGQAGSEYAVFDYINRRAYLINYTTGAYVSTVQFPATSGAPSNYSLSYANGLYFIYNGTNWIGYQSGIAAFSSPTTLCSGNSATLTVNGATTYTWNPGALTGSNVVVTPTASTVYSITSNAVGCSATTLSLTVNQTPTITVNSGAACSGASFTMTPSGASTYTFSSGSAVVTPTANASYSVTGTSSLGCISNVAISTVSVGATPTITVNSGAVCAGGSFTMNPTGASTYTFSNGSAVVTPSANASYSITGTSSVGCVASNTAVSSVSVNANPTVTAVSNTTLICSGQTATLTAGGASTYTWNTSATTSVVLVTPSVTTSYTVTGANASGCTNAITITQSVSACAGIAANQLANTIISVYPNPNNGEFTISTDSDMNLSIVNNLGQVVKEILINTSNNHKASVSNLANGIYFVVGKNNDQIIKTKIVVSK